MNDEAKKDIEYYTELPYTRIVEPINDESGRYYFARILELDGCWCDGETEAEALAELRVVMRGWLEVKLQHGDKIPEPKSKGENKGKFTLRLPKSLHHRLAIEAEAEGVSLNQYALYKLSQ